MNKNHTDVAMDTHAQKETPDTVGTVAGATNFQQSKTILALSLHRLNAIFCTRGFSLGDLLTIALLVALVEVLA